MQVFARHLIVFALLTAIGCSIGTPSTTENVVAIVDDKILFKDQIEALAKSALDVDDSTKLVNNYIDDWAKKQLLLTQAKINLNEESQFRLDELTESYRQDLYIKSYQEMIVKSNIDTILTPQQIIMYFEENKSNFKLNIDLIQARYLKVNKSNYNLKEIRTRFKRFKPADKEFLDSIKLQFNAYFLNDSIWIQAIQMANKIKPLGSDDFDRFLKKSQFFELEDSLEVYLVHVKDVLRRNDLAPLPYVEPTIRQILLNKRKLDFIRKFENDILQDARQKNRFKTRFP